MRSLHPLRRLLPILVLCWSSMSWAIAPDSTCYIIVLGIAQDGGYPHAGCQRKCCARAWANPTKRRFVTSLALVDPTGNKWWLFEATPDFRDQLQYFRLLTGARYNYLPDGIFITHAHMGHYTGLMHLGKEVMGAKGVPVYALPRLQKFLETNGPWSQLVSLHNIDIRPLYIDKPGPASKSNEELKLSDGISVSTFTVPHRDEYSETAGFRISTPSKTYLFIPDIDKWDKWDRNIIAEVADCDIALLDATFYQDGELPGRSMSEVPHPFVAETIARFTSTPQIADLAHHIHFIHFNHTNPLMWDSLRRQEVLNKGFHLAIQGEQL